METFQIEDKTLTLKVRSLFGDIVETAYIESSSIYYMKKEIEKIHNHIKHSKKRELDVNYCDIVIKFTNGKIISFSISEWGKIRTIDKLNLI